MRTKEGLGEFVRRAQVKAMRRGCSMDIRGREKGCLSEGTEQTAYILEDMEGVL